MLCALKHVAELQEPCQTIIFYYNLFQRWDERQVTSAQALSLEHRLSASSLAPFRPKQLSVMVCDGPVGIW